MLKHHLASVGGPDGDLCTRHGSLDSLLVRVGEGDRVAFAALYDEMSRTVYAMSLSGGHDPALAAHITLDVFLCAWLRAGAYDPRVESAWTWLRAIAATTITAQSRSRILTRVVATDTPDNNALESEPHHV